MRLESLISICVFLSVWPVCLSTRLSLCLAVCRYYGVSDPVAEKIFKQIDSLPKIEIPEDRSISTLYIGGLDGIVTEKDLRYVWSVTQVYTVCVCMVYVW